MEKEERLIKYREAFLNKVKKWNWNDDWECPYKRRGRKPKQVTRPDSRPRSNGEKQVLKQSKYNWL